MFINGGQLSTGWEVCLGVRWCQEKGGPSGWLGSERRGSFSSGNYCPHSPNASRWPSIHTSKLSLLELQKNKSGRQVRLFSAAMLLAFQTMCLLNPVCPFNCEFLEVQVSAGEGPRIHCLPGTGAGTVWVGADSSVVLSGGIPWSPIFPDDLASLMDRVELGMCCPGKAALEKVC